VGPGYAMRVHSGEKMNTFFIVLRQVTLKITGGIQMSDFEKLAHALWQCKNHIV